MGHLSVFLILEFKYIYANDNYQILNITEQLDILCKMSMLPLATRLFEAKNKKYGNSSYIILIFRRIYINICKAKYTYGGTYATFN